MKTKISLDGKTILVTGSPGFIGANLVLRLLKEMKGGTIVSLDNMNDYYDPKLKEYRLSLIEKAVGDAEKQYRAVKAFAKVKGLAFDPELLPVRHVFVKGSIGDKALVDRLFEEYHFDVVVGPVFH